MKKFLLSIVLAVALGNVFGATYYWVGGNTSSGSFTTTSNWNTLRAGGGSSPATITASGNTNDIFIFDYLNVGGAVPTTGISITITTTLTSYQLGGIQVLNGNNFYVKFSGGGAMTLNTNLIVDANSFLEFTSNTFTFGGSFSPTVNGTLIFGGQGTTTTFPIGTDWTLNNATGTIAYNYNYPQGNCRIIPATYYNLDADYGTGVNRNFGTLNTSQQNFVIKGNFYYTANTNAVQTSVFTFSGDNQTIAPIAFYGLVISGTGIKTISKTGSVGNTLNTLTTSTTATNSVTGFGLTVNSGAVLDLGDFVLSGTVISNSGEIRAATAASLPTPGTLPWGGTVTYNGTGTQSIPATSFTSLKMTGAKSSSVSFTGTSTSGSTILTNISSTNGLMGLTSGTITGTAGIGASNATTNTISSVTRGATIKGNTINGSAQLTTVNATNLAVGMTLSGTGIPSGTIINTIDQAAQLTSAITATSGSNVLSATSTSDVKVGMYVIAAGNTAIPSGTAVTVTNVVTNTSITISSSATGNVSTATGINFSALITMSGNATTTNSGNIVTCSPIITMGSSASASNSSQSVSIPTSLTLASGTTNVASNMTVDYTGGYGSIVNTGSTFNFNGTGAQTIPSLNYNNLTLSGSRSGDITLASSGSIGIAGTFTNSATFTSGSLVNTGSTVNFNGAAQTLPAFTFNHLTLSGSGAKTLNASTIINGNLLLQGTATTSTVAATTIGGNLSVGDATSAATFTSAGYDLTVNGTTTVANLSTLTISSSTGSKTFTGLVTINGGGTWNNSINSAVSLNGGLTIGGSSVTFTPGTNTTAITGALTTNGTFSLSTGTVSLSGISSIAGSTAPTFNTLTLATSSAVTASTNFTVSGTLTINTSASLDMGTNNLLGATTITNSGTLKTSSIGTTPFPSGKTITGTVQFAATGGGQTIPLGTYTTLTILNSTGTNSSSGGAVNVQTTLNTTAGGTWDMGTTATLGGSLSTINHNGIIKTAVLSSISTSPTTTKDFTAGGTATGTVEFYGTGDQSLQNNSLTKFYNLTIRSGSIATAVTATSSLTVNGTLTIDGTMDMGTSSLTVVNNVLGAGTFKTQNTGTPITIGKTWGCTVQYNSTSAQNVVAGNYNNLDLTAASAGNRTLVNGSTIAIAGTFTPSTTGTHTVTGNTISFNGSSAQTIPAFAYNNLTVNNSAGVSLGASISVAGSLALSAGTLTVGANTLTLSGSSPTRTSGSIDASNASAVVAFTNGSSMTLPASLFSGAISTLTVNGIGGVTLSEGITISKALNLTSGTITTSGTNIVTFNSGNATPVEIIRTAGGISGISQAFTSTVNLTYNNTTTTTSGFEVPLTTTKLNNLTINNAGGVVMSADRTINGTLTLSAGTLTIGTVSTPRNLVYKGSSITRTSGNIDASIAGATAGITFSNTSALSLPTGLFSGNLNTLTVNGIGGTVTLPEAVTVNGATNVGAGAIVAIGGTLITTGVATINGTLQLNPSGSISTAPTYGSSSTLIYNTGGSLTATNTEWPTTSSPANVTVQNSTALTLNGDKTISGTLALTSGSMATGANTLTLKGGISGSGTIDTSAGTLAFGGTSEQTLDGANVLSSTVNNLVVNAGSKLTTTGTLSATNLTINSTTDGGTGSLTGTLKGTLTSTNANVNQYLTNHTWYMSSPVSSATPTHMDVIKYFDETVSGNSWPAATTMTAGTGYFVTPNASYNNILFSGTLNTGSQPITLTNSTATNTDYPGFNLIGNPYPAFLDWTAVCAYTTDGGSTHPNQAIMPTVTMWYRTKVSGSWGFVTVNNGVTTPSGNNVTNYIPPMQAFWVRTNANAVQLQLTNSMCSHAATANALKAPAAKNAEQLQLVRLQLNNGILTDEAVIYFSANANNGFDIYDAPKMKNSDISIPGIYTMLNNEQIVINAMNSIPLNQEISLGFVPGSASSFSIKANEVSNLPAGVKLILKDNVSNVETDLSNSVTGYNFSSAIASNSRFSVIFRSSGTVTAAVDTDTKNMSIYRNANNHIEVNCSNDISDNAFISVYNALGQKLESKQISSTTTVIEKTFNSGVYLVTVTNGVKSITKKVILN